MKFHTVIIISVLMWFVAGATASAQIAPVLSFDRKLAVFDTLAFRDGPVKAVFECTNISDKDVHILDVHTYCRCLSIHFDKKTIKPGGKAVVEAELSTEKLNAWQEHRFTVLSSDGGEVMTNSLKMAGYVRRDTK